jgi:phospholipase/carboxylesterase
VSTSFEDAFAIVGNATLKAAAKFETIQRHLHPPDIGFLRDELTPFVRDLASARDTHRDVEAPAGLEQLRSQMNEAAELVLRAGERFCREAAPDQWMVDILGAMRTFARGLEKLYPLHRLPPVGRYFTEPPLHDRLAELDPDPPHSESTGLHSTGNPQDPGERGGFCLYVPEYYDEARSWPLVVTLHGGSGSGRDYLWLWLREARSRGFLVLAPTATGATWSMIGPDVDARAIDSMVEYVCKNWSVDRARMLLTGLSDGATYGLMAALTEDSKFSAVAPIAGVLHPAVALERRVRAEGKRIYLVHGALDWMFPVEYARSAHEQLVRAGADVVYREIGDLSHTYPREENDRILAWFDPALALPAASSN